MAVENLADALHDEIKDILSAEKQLVKALPKMIKAATSEDLAQAIEDHLEETKTHVTRIEQALKAMGKPIKAKTCEGMKGIIEEGQEVVGEAEEGPVCDAMIIAAAQKVEHYEIASYGTAIAWAQQLGMDQVAEILNETLEEEKAADEKLTSLSESINPQANEEPQEAEA